MIDITREISPDTEVYPGDSETKITKVKSIEKDDYALSKIEMSLHCGTHVDAPSHYISGAKDVEDLPALIKAPAIFCENVFEVDINRGDFVLMKEELSLDEAEYLIKKEVFGVGVECLTIGSKDVHLTLLSKDIIVIEGLDLKEVKKGKYTLYCMPLRIKGVEGAPVRCILM